MTELHSLKLKKKEQRESQDTEREEDPSVQASVHPVPHVKAHAEKQQVSAEDPQRALQELRDSLPKDPQEHRAAREDLLMFREDRAHTP